MKCVYCGQEIWEGFFEGEIAMLSIRDSNIPNHEGYIEKHTCKTRNGIAYTSSTNSVPQKAVQNGCGNNALTTLYGKKLEVFCGDIILGELRLCNECEKNTKNEPQNKKEKDL